MGKHVRLTPLSGIGNTTGSVWHVGYGRQGFLIDFGLDLGRRAELLGPRLRLRDSRGLQDPIRLGLLPALEGLYREDLLFDDDLLEDVDELDVRAVLLSHLHADHAAQLYSLDPAIPIHSSKISAALAHACTLSGTGLSSETTLVVPRSLHEHEKGLLVKARGIDAIPRQWCTVDGPPSAKLRDFCGGSFGEVLAESSMDVAGLQFRAYEIDHSLYGAVCYEFLAPEGPVVFLTDVRKHGRWGHKTEALIEHLEKRRPAVLILEGTRLGRKGDCATTERQARLRIRDLVESAHGRRLVIGIVSQTHLERLSAFNAAAIAAGRKLVVQPRVMLLLEAVKAADSTTDFGLDDLLILDMPSVSRPQWHRELRERYADRLVSADDLKRHPGQYVLATTAQRRPEWIDIQPDRALMIYSASGAYTDEGRGELSALKLWAEMYKMDVAGFTSSGADPALCPSGHMHPEELRELLARVRPRVLIPVHTDHPEMFTELLPPGTRIVYPENGRTIRL